MRKFILRRFLSSNPTSERILKPLCSHGRLAREWIYEPFAKISGSALPYRGSKDYTLEHSTGILKKKKKLGKMHLFSTTERQHVACDIDKGATNNITINL